MRPFHVYLLQCADGSYYCGHTDDLDRRMQQHTDGVIGYTATRKPAKLVWQGEFESRDAALAFELQVKGWSRAKKEALIGGDWDRIKDLAKGGGGAGPSTGSGPSTSSGQSDRGGADPSTSSGRTDGYGSGRTDGCGSGRTDAGGEGASVPAGLKALMGPAGPAQRRAIAKAITLLESTRHDHRRQADELLTALLPHTGNSFRLGISGVPGVGKSTFIEALGLLLIERGHRVAVLAIDPSSSVSGGSILGDKTRMERLSVNDKAYIRPSPASGTLGGVAEKTREAMLVCEAAGYDIVIVETVGVGQSETAVAGMTDMFVLMQLPNAGDDLQAIKKGVMELADLVLVNKADIDADAATRAQAQLTSALRLFSQHGRARKWHARVLQLSALNAQGIDRFWSVVEEFRDQQTASGQLLERRRQQALAWMWERIEAGLQQEFRGNPAVREMLPRLSEQVQAGQVPASTAARQLLALSKA